MAQAILRVAIIADDLTGAMDAAVPFARRGRHVRVLTDSRDLSTASRQDTEVLSVNTDTRHCPADQAESIIREATHQLLQLQPELLVKKIDSTMRGHVVRETAAVMQVAGKARAVVCPAVPSQGRTLKNGELFLDGIPLRETTIGRDLRSPPPCEPLPELFKKKFQDTSIRGGKIDRTDWPVRPDCLPEIYIADAATSTDMLALAETTKEGRGDTLFVGASGLTEALAEILYGTDAGYHDGKSSVSGLPLFVVGSLAPQAAVQVRTLRESDPNVLLKILENTEPLDDVIAKQIYAAGKQCSALVVQSPEVDNQPWSDPDRVVGALADIACRLLQQCSITVLVATGGDTARAVLNRLEINEIKVIGEIEPGVVHGLIDRKGEILHLVTKAGSFGDADLFVTIRNYFR